MQQREIGVAVIGCGVIAPTHIDSFNRIDGVRVVCLCDTNKDRAEKLSGRYNISRIVDDYRYILDSADVNCISICTDHASHSLIATDSLLAGKHVLCEKALATSSAEMDAMFSTHQNCSELVFSGVFQHRFDYVYGRLKQLVEQGVFGKILTAGVQMRCHRTNDYYLTDEWRGTWAREGGSVLINQAIHYIDLLSWIVGDIDSLCGTYANLTHGNAIETDDTATAALRFKNGALGTLSATCSSHSHWAPVLFVHGENGSVEIRDDKLSRLEVEDDEKRSDLEAFLKPPMNTPIRDCRGKKYYGSGHPAQIADFVDAVRECRDPFVTAASARHAVDTVLAVYESQHQGRWVSV